MSSWILLAVGAQFINAIVALIDKHIVSDDKAFPSPFVYAFYTCLISGAWVLVYLISLFPLPFNGLHVPTFENVIRPTLGVVALAFLSAYSFFIALVSMFSALREQDASDVIPVIGSISALCSFGLGYYFLDARLSPNFMLGIALLATGTALVSRFRFPAKTALVAFHSGLFFALHYIALKGLFNETSFDNGFFWSRIAFVFFALSLLLIPNYWERIRDQTKSTGHAARMLIVSNKVLAGVSTILILKATDMGDVAVVQALGGLQFVFILVLGILFSRAHPPQVKIKEKYDKRSILQKAIFVSIISLGFLILFT